MFPATLLTRLRPTTNTLSRRQLPTSQKVFTTRSTRVPLFPTRPHNRIMSTAAATDDPTCPATGMSKASRGDLAEFSVVYTDRAVNLMSAPFQEVMRDIASSLKKVYNAQGCCIIPGSGTYGMEAVARTFGTNKKCLVIRNGFFSFRWSDIFDVCKIPSEEIVMKARAVEDDPTPSFAPCPIDEVVAKIKAERPAAVFAPHVETATGMVLPDEYIQAVSAATHEVGGLFVLDCVASGTSWVDMGALGIDALVTAPQKGWSGPACAGIVMLSAKGVEAAKNNESTSYCCQLNKWLTVMEAYEGGGFMYFTTLPTDALTTFRNAIKETEAMGLEKAREQGKTLGEKVRAVLESRGFKSVAAEGVKSTSVIVSYATKPDLVARFKAEGLQIAGGVPFKIDEPEGLMTFRVGLFGLDKVGEKLDDTVARFTKALDGVVKSME